MKTIVVLGGGTMSPIRNHLSLCAPAFGTTAKIITNTIKSRIKDSEFNVECYLTKMAESTSNIKTNKDVDVLINNLINNKLIKTIILNVAFCDFYSALNDSSFHGERLKTSDGPMSIPITPSAKIIDKIRRKRPDIFLVGFKTTTNKSPDEQFLIALKMMKRSKCNLVLANDTVTRHNMIITPEEVSYCNTTDREKVLNELVDITLLRHDLTYARTNFIDFNSVSFNEAPSTFKDVILHLVNNGGFIENNGNGFTPGHFCYIDKNDARFMISSQRKVNHNHVVKNGMTKIKINNNVLEPVVAIGRRKPSVGARSQLLLLQKFPDYDCVVHTHTPLKKESRIPIASQRAFQCGSLECGLNTINNISFFNDGKIGAVMLDKHGPNIIFNSRTESSEIIRFIDENLTLGVKTK